MKKSKFVWGFAPLAACAFLLPTAASAQTPYTATGSVIGAPVPGIWQTNALGQVIMRGNAHLVRVDSSEPRLTGQRLIFVDGNAQADGTALIWGTSYQEVGIFDATGQFTPTGGMWQNTYRGTMGADNSLELHSIGSGWGGTIDGLGIDEMMTRAPASGPIDPAVPYEYTGTLTPPPLSTNLVLDDFSGTAVGWIYYGPSGSYSYTRPNGQLKVSGYWPGVTTRNVPDTYTLGAPPPRASMTNGQTLEARVDLVNLNQSATAARLALGTESGFYSLFKGHDFIALSIWSANLPWGPVYPVVLFFYEPAQVPDADVVLSLALTKDNANVVITTRVLDKGNPNSVLYERRVVDTPNADAALTSAAMLGLSGMSLELSPDLAGAPIAGGGVSVGVWQYNHDGQQPAAEATYDNLELRQYEIPPLGIARAVALTWPDVGSYRAESAPSVQGPWLPLPDVSTPGFQQMTVPMSSPAQFFRLIQAP